MQNTQGVYRLIRQQLRRQQGIPTLSLLVGKAPQAIDLWRYWAQVTNKTTCIGVASAFQPLLQQWRDTHALDALLLHDIDVGVWMLLLQDITQRIEANPALSVALVLDAAQFEQCLRTLPECHAKALLREGVIHLLDGPYVETQDVDAAPYANTVRLLQKLPTCVPLLQRFYTTVYIIESCQKTDFQRARSAAEQFLFDVLQALPATTNLFALNATCDFKFGAAQAEVDLLAKTLHIAIEIDGYYHFRAPDNFRHDRRKDFALQARGYLVLRFLAEDVVTLLEDILGTIKTAIRLKGDTHDAESYIR